MPSSFRFLPRFRPKAKTRSGPRLFHLVPIGLLAIAVGGALAAWTGQRTHGRTTGLLSVTQPRVQGWGGGLPGRFKRQARQRPPLIVPPQVLPQPLPPPQAWPELSVVPGHPGFTDITPDHWAWPVLTDLAQRGLISGFPEGDYRPADPMTRAEFAAQLARLFDLPQAPSKTPERGDYPDLSTDHWAYASVQKAVQMGFLTGYPEGVFLPEQTVTRIGVVVALANGLMLKSSRGTGPVLAIYSDRSQVPAWATRQLVAATEAGLVVNYPDPAQLAPNKTATRAEVAAMLHRALVYTGYLQDVPLPYVVGQPVVTP